MKRLLKILLQPVPTRVAYLVIYGAVLVAIAAAVAAPHGLGLTMSGVGVMALGVAAVTE